MMAKRHRQQVTCNCSAYDFPHRLGSGRCHASVWAENYFIVVREVCECCNSLNNGESGCRGERHGTCDVAGGLESIEHCEGYQDHLQAQPAIRLPISENDFFEQQYLNN